MRDTVPRPFLKWAGGKTQLLKALAARIPRELGDSALPVYIEPFVGGGAVFFTFASTFPFRESHIFDCNEELILAYTVVRDDVDALIRNLAEISGEYLAKTDAGRRTCYYELRDHFNQAKQDMDFSRFDPSWTWRAAELIFLNRTCFNGLFRVNAAGEFNVPFGKYPAPAIPPPGLLKADARLLRNTVIHLGDFTAAELYVSGDSFVYLDPPYRPISTTSHFTSYAKDRFDDDDQRRLALFFRRCDAAGAKLMLSNSDPRNHDPGDDFFDTLYAGFRIERVPAKRMINADGTGRGTIFEIIVMNYEPETTRQRHPGPVRRSQGQNRPLMDNLPE